MPAMTAEDQEYLDYVERVLSLPAPFKECRIEGHPWRRLTKYRHYAEETVGRKTTLYVAHDYQCPGCGNGKVKVFRVERGRRTDRIIYVRTDRVYVDGFLLQGVPAGADAKEILRQDDWRRSMEETAHAAPGERERADR